MGTRQARGVEDLVEAARGGRPVHGPQTRRTPAGCQGRDAARKRGDARVLDCAPPMSDDIEKTHLTPRAHPILPALWAGTRAARRPSRRQARDGLHGLRFHLLPEPEGRRRHHPRRGRAHPPHPARHPSVATASGRSPAATSTGASRWTWRRSARRTRRRASGWSSAASSASTRIPAAPVAIVVYRARVLGGTITRLPRERPRGVGRAGRDSLGGSGLPVHHRRPPRLPRGPLTADPRAAGLSGTATAGAREYTRRMPAPVVLAAFGALLVSLDASLNIALPAVAAAFGIGPAAVRWMIICYVGTYALTAFGAGILADRLGALRVFTAGLWLSAAVFAAYCAGAVVCRHAGVSRGAGRERRADLRHGVGAGDAVAAARAPRPRPRRDEPRPRRGRGGGPGDRRAPRRRLRLARGLPLPRAPGPGAGRGRGEVPRALAPGGRPGAAEAGACRRRAAGRAATGRAGLPRDVRAVLRVAPDPLLPRLRARDRRQPGGRVLHPVPPRHRAGRAAGGLGRRPPRHAMADRHRARHRGRWASSSSADWRRTARSSRWSPGSCWSASASASSRCPT